MTKESSQTINGKAFEYALLNEFFFRLNSITNVSIVQNQPFKNALRCFDIVSEKEKDAFRLNANFAVNLLIGLEPRLSNHLSIEDTLELEIVSDSRGQEGDVRDVLAIRSLQKWEIGISAKNNHRAIKHSRLSNDIDFGVKWLGIPCSDNYFQTIKPIFDNLREIKTQSNSTHKWSELGDYHSSIYVPVLDAFRAELLQLDRSNPGIVAANLVRYLIGHQDFYKVIKGRNEVEVQAYNLHGSLNLPFKDIKPIAKVERLKFPSRLIEVAYLNNSKTTLMVTLDEGWQITFRIHNASSRVEPSLKFDINLLSSPRSLFVNKLFLA